MQIGNDVILQKFDGEDVHEYDAIVIAANGDELALAYFNADKAHFLGGVDWRLAFDRVDGVKPEHHDDVADGKEGFAYRLEADDQTVEEEHA